MADPYVEFFLNSKSSIVQFETIEISHTNFSQIFRIVRNNADGLTANLETGEEVVFDYYPMQITENETKDDLDYTLSIDFGDLGEVLPTELDLVASSDGFFTKPELLYRTFRSDDLTAPMFGPIDLDIMSFAFNETSVTIEAAAPRINLHKTGEKYTIDRFPGLRAFVE